MDTVRIGLNAFRFKANRPDVCWEPRMTYSEIDPSDPPQDGCRVDGLMLWSRMHSLQMSVLDV